MDNLIDFFNNLANNQIDVDPDIAKIINDNFKDLLSEL